MKKPTKLERQIAQMLYDCCVELIPVETFHESYVKIFGPSFASTTKSKRSGKSKKKKFNEQFTAGESIDSSAFNTRAKTVKKKIEPDTSAPSNIKEFTLPDGSVIYINTDKTEMEVNDASDYFK